jgi:protocatechuate 3,4-dioxygenase beta subunit
VTSEQEKPHPSAQKETMNNPREFVEINPVINTKSDTISTDNHTDNDDEMVGRILNRREVLATLGGSVLMLGLTSCQTAEAAKTSSLPGCIVRPEETEGPYFVDEKLLRSDVRSDPATGKVSDGIPLWLKFKVSQIGSSCSPLAGAWVDIWHCDSSGVYSDAQDPSFNTKGQKFLRGYQITDSSGLAQFVTIYPGWYEGRAVHIHFKIRTLSGKTFTHEFTSQLFFDDTLSDQIFKLKPYSNKPGTRSVRNANDGIYRNGGSQLLLEVTKEGAGYTGTFDIALKF